MGRGRQSALKNDNADRCNGFELEDMDLDDVRPTIKGFKIKTPKTVFNGWKQPQIKSKHRKKLVQ